MLASGFGASLTTTFWDRRAAVHHATLVENVSAYNPIFTDQMQALGGHSLPGYALIEQIVSTQSYMLSTVELFWFAAWTFLLLIPLVWTTQPLHRSPKPTAPLVIE
jgi:DHA2 family multidrug resistance protein